jgi:pimeloyl-ACP methyl ester carboxylesterase
VTDTGPDPPRGPGPSFVRWRIVAGVVIVGFVAGGLIATWAVQRFVTFPRPPASAWNPDARRAAGGEQVWLDARGDRVEAWLLPARSHATRVPLIIYAHGNGELIDMRAQDFTRLRAAGYAVLQVEFPGYGRSEGSPSEESVTAALVAAYDWAAASRRFDTQRISGYGRSLGGGAIAQLAARRPLAALVLESTFVNLEDVVMGYGVPRCLLLNHFDTGKVLRGYHGPVLLLHGTRDRVFASAQSQALARFAQHATLHLEPCGHNDCPPQWELVRSFLGKNSVCRAQNPEAPDETDPC